MKQIFGRTIPARHLAFSLIGILIYFAAFFMLHVYLEMRPIPIIIFPMVALCWFWGARRGLLAGTILILSSIFFAVTFHIHTLNPSAGIMAIIMAFSLGSFAGWSRKLFDREKRYSQILAEERRALLKEVEERRKTENRALWDEYFLKTMTNSSPLGILAINNQTDEILYCNHRFCQIWNVENFEEKVAIKEIKGSEFVELCHRNLQDFEYYKKHFSPSLDLKSLDTATIDIKFKDGRIIRRFTSPIMGKNDLYLGRLFMYEDVTETKRSEFLLERIYQYEHLIYTVSNHFVKVPADKIDEAFISALKETAEFLQMDMGFFYHADLKSGTAENLYEWRSRKVSVYLLKISRLDSALLPNFKKKLLNYEQIIIPDIEKLPPVESMEKEYMQKRGIRSLVIFPVVFNDVPIGFLGFSSQTPIQFPEDATSMLKIISDIFGGAFMRREKTNELLIREERFRLLVQNSADMITVVDQDGNLLYASEAAGRVMGYKSGDRTGLSMFNFVHPDDAPKIKGIIQMILSKRISTSDPQYVRVKHTSGRYIYLESIFTGQLGNPAINGIVINSRDFSQHLAFQEALRNSRNFLNAIINSASDPMFVKDSTLKWVLVNDAFCRLTGYKREEMLGKTAFEIFPDDEAHNFLRKNEKTLNTGEIGEYEVSFTDSQNNKHFIVSNLSCYEEESGDKFLIANLRDETRRQELQNELNIALQKEKELNQLKSKFISMVSHEYRTPLTTILSSAELIELFGPDMEDSEKLDYLNNIKNSVDYLTSLLDDVLLINRAESGRMHFDPGSFELVSFCRDLIKNMMNGIKCRVEFLAGFDSRYVFMDKKLLRHILTNLLSNAIKYSGENATVWLSISCSEAQVNFEIKDKGPGIYPGDQMHLFEPFFRADSISHIPGSGLGLSIVKNCVDLHNGTISFESIPGEGTIFLVSLPCEN